MLGTLAALVFGYLLGSIPFGLLVTRAAGLGDLLVHFAGMANQFIQAVGNFP